MFPRFLVALFFALALTAACCGKKPASPTDTSATGSTNWLNHQPRLVETDEKQVGDNVSGLTPTRPLYLADGAGEEAVIGSSVGSVTLSVGEVSGPIFVGAWPSTLAHFKVWYEGEGEATFRVPPITVTKTGGAPWKTTEDVHRVLPRISLGVTNGDKISFEEQPVLTLRDENTVVCDFSRVISLRQTFNAELKIMVRATSPAWDIPALYGSMQAGKDNIVCGTTHASSGSAIGAKVSVRIRDITEGYWTVRSGSTTHVTVVRDDNPEETFSCEAAYEFKKGAVVVIRRKEIPGLEGYDGDPKMKMWVWVATSP